MRPPSVVLLRPSVLASLLGHAALLLIAGTEAVALSERPAPRLVGMLPEAPLAPPEEDPAEDTALPDSSPAVEVRNPEPPPPRDEPAELREEELAEGVVIGLGPRPSSAVLGVPSSGLPGAQARARRRGRGSFPAAAATVAPAPRGPTTDARPAPGSAPPPYPTLARSSGWQGTVRLWVRVEADGTVSTVWVDASSGWPVLDDAAASAARGWRWWPALREGVPVASTVGQTLEFVLPR